MSRPVAASPVAAHTSHPRLQAWVREIAELTRPHAVYWCDGSAGEYERLCQGLVDAGRLERLSDAKLPNCSSLGQIRATSGGLRIGRSSARPGEMTLDRRTTGARRLGCVPCVHSVGMPLADGAQDAPWPCNAESVHIVHFPETREIWSLGSGYGGNALLGKARFGERLPAEFRRQLARSERRLSGG